MNDDILFEELGDLDEIASNTWSKYMFPVITFSDKSKDNRSAYVNILGRKFFSGSSFSVFFNANFIVFQPNERKEIGCYSSNGAKMGFSFSACNLLNRCPDLKGHTYKIYSVKGTEKFCIKRGEPIDERNS